MAHSKTVKHAVLRLPLDESQETTRSAKDAPAAKTPTVRERTAGRISHDERGNAVFKRRSGDSTSTMLRRLELPGLKVEGQEEPPPPLAKAAPPVAAVKAKAASRPEPGGGYNPYDQSRAITKPTTPKGPVGRKR